MTPLQYQEPCRAHMHHQQLQGQPLNAVPGAHHPMTSVNLSQTHCPPAQQEVRAVDLDLPPAHMQRQDQAHPEQLPHGRDPRYGMSQHNSLQPQGPAPPDHSTYQMLVQQEDARQVVLHHATQPPGVQQITTQQDRPLQANQETTSRTSHHPGAQAEHLRGPVHPQDQQFNQPPNHAVIPQVGHQNLVKPDHILPEAQPSGDQTTTQDQHSQMASTLTSTPIMPSTSVQDLTQFVSCVTNMFKQIVPMMHQPTSGPAGHHEGGHEQPSEARRPPARHRSISGSRTPQSTTQSIRTQHTRPPSISSPASHNIRRTTSTKPRRDRHRKSPARSKTDTNKTPHNFEDPSRRRSSPSRPAISPSHTPSRTRSSSRPTSRATPTIVLKARSRRTDHTSSSRRHRSLTPPSSTRHPTTRTNSEMSRVEVHHNHQKFTDQEREQ